MKYIMTKSFMFYVLVIFGSTTYGYAESAPNLPKSIQSTLEDDTITKIDKIEIIPEVTLSVSSTSDKVDQKLKEGVACDDEVLEAAILGPDMVELPMAQTEDCSVVDCENLDHAILHKDNYKKIPMAKTIKGCEK